MCWCWIGLASATKINKYASVGLAWPVPQRSTNMLVLDWPGQCHNNKQIFWCCIGHLSSQSCCCNLLRSGGVIFLALTGVLFLAPPPPAKWFIIGTVPLTSRATMDIYTLVEIYSNLKLRQITVFALLYK
jgi:hypothetical protein